MHKHYHFLHILTRMNYNIPRKTLQVFYTGRLLREGVEAENKQDWECINKYILKVTSQPSRILGIRTIRVSGVKGERDFCV